MTTNRHYARLAATITMVLAFLLMPLISTPAHRPASTARTPITVAAAAHVPAAGGHAPGGRATIATTGEDEQEHDQPALSYSQAVRLMHTVTPGLVDIDTTSTGGEGKAGTGIVLTPTGRIMTNYHVISGATGLSVHDLGNGLDYAASIVGVDRVHDIAVLQLVGATHLHTVGLGGRVSIGTLASIGNAAGRGDPSLGAGPVVALHRSITSTTGQTRPLPGLIEATNGVEPGESGRTHGHRSPERSSASPSPPSSARTVRPTAMAMRFPCRPRWQRSTESSPRPERHHSNWEVGRCWPRSLHRPLLHPQRARPDPPG